MRSIFCMVTCLDNRHTANDDESYQTKPKYNQTKPYNMITSWTKFFDSFVNVLVIWQFWDNFKTRAKKGKMKIGLAHSMLMAGVYKDSSDKLLKKCGFEDRDMVEHEGPERAAHDMIELIKNTAIDKRKSLKNKNIKEVDVTVATIGDSRTGKSEMAEKMEGVLNMSLI